MLTFYSILSEHVDNIMTKSIKSYAWFNFPTFFAKKFQVLIFRAVGPPDKKVGIKCDLACVPYAGGAINLKKVARPLSRFAGNFFFRPGDFCNVRKAGAGTRLKLGSIRHA